MSKVLVTGGAGFIGSYICEELAAAGHEVLAYDCFTCFVPDVENYSRYVAERRARLEGKAKIVRGNINDASRFAAVLDEFNPQRIINLAALPIADMSKTFSDEAISNNLMGVLTMLELIKKRKGIERFVLISSSMIYGDFQYVPCDEEHPKSPKSLYGGTKLAAEIMTSTFGRSFDIPYAIVRPSAVYGFGDVNRRVTGLYLDAALTGKPMILNNGGDAMLDFTHVTDIAHGIVLAALEPKAEGETFNITRGEGRSLKELAEIIRGHFPQAKIEVRDVVDTRPKRGALDISKAKQLLGYEPQYRLEEGMARYVRSVRTFLGK